MVRLPSLFEEQILNAPESYYGVVTITVTLKNGTRIKDVDVSASGQVLRCAKKHDIPFSSEDITGIEIQNPKKIGNGS